MSVDFTDLAVAVVVSVVCVCLTMCYHADRAYEVERARANVECVRVGGTVNEISSKCVRTAEQPPPPASGSPAPPGSRR